jgi:hypothetical protein
MGSEWCGKPLVARIVADILTQGCQCPRLYPAVSVLQDLPGLTLYYHLMANIDPVKHTLLLLHK